MNPIERLETRRLMTLDLQIEHDPVPAAGPGDQVTRVIRVFNNGDEPAEQVVIRSSLTDELVDPIWERTLGTGKFIANPTEGREPDFSIFTSIDHEIDLEGVFPIGDVNGDGLEDFYFHRRVRRQSRDWSSLVSVVFGGATADIEAPLGSIGAQDGFNVAIMLVGGPIVPQFEPLGDINHDGFDDFAIYNTIVLGGANIGQDNGKRIVVPDALRLEGIGDINADGIDDFVIGDSGDAQYLVWGDPALGDLTEISVADLRAGDIVDRGMTIQCTSPEGCLVLDAAPVGDLNNDGFQDVAFDLANSGTTVFFGGPEFSSQELRQNQVDGTNGFRIEFDDPSEPRARDRTYFGFEVASTIPEAELRSAGDIDGDGVDDLLLAFNGGNCAGSCTSSAKRGMDVVGGAAIIFGATDLGTDGAFDPNRDRHETYRISVPYRDQRPVPSVHDINADGLNDISLLTGQVAYTVYGDSELTDIDFGFGGIGLSLELGIYKGLNGEIGFGRFGDFSYIDINGDGMVDELLRERSGPKRTGRYSVFLGRELAAPPTVAGSGDIVETLDIAAGTSVVYTVRGTVREDATRPSSTVLPRVGQQVEDLRDNLASDKSGVLLNVELISPPLPQPGERVQFEVRVANDGPANATNVRLSETISSELEDVTWNRTQRFPPSIQLAELQGALGAQFTGPKRIYAEREHAPGYDGALLVSLGTVVGSRGDVTGDGFDDIFAIATNARKPRSEWPTIEYLGSEDFGIDGAFPRYDSIDPTSERPVISPVRGDVNGDGFEDEIIGDPRAEDNRGATYVIYGNEAGIPTVPLSELNGTNGFRILGASPANFAGSSVATGDVNGDAFSDVIIGEAYNDDELYDFRRRRRPFAYVLYGGASVGVSGNVSLASLDGTNGFRMATGQHRFFGSSRSASVASGFDINGDGVDDILIGDTGGGQMANFTGQHHGALYLVFGRPQSEASGTGPIDDDPFSVPLGVETTYTIAGTVPEEWIGRVVVSAEATVSPSHVELDPDSNEVRVELNSPFVRADLDQDAIVGFSDFLILSANFGRTDPRADEGDLDQNNVVDFADLVLLLNAFGHRSAVLPV